MTAPEFKSCWTCKHDALHKLAYPCRSCGLVAGDGFDKWEPMTASSPPAPSPEAKQEPVISILREMVEMMDRSDEHGAGSDWHKRATAALAAHQATEVGEDTKRDAARYRWLRECDWFTSPLCVLRNPKEVFKRGNALGADCPSHGRLDAAIDAAVRAQQLKDFR